MKNIIITGGSGFLGQRLARELLRLSEAGGKTGHQPADRIVLVDVARPQTEIADPRVRFAIGDAADPQFVRETLSNDTDGIFHLAAVVSGAAEANFDLGMRVNLDGTRTLLEACRRLPRPPRFMFASSLAVFGPHLPGVVTDSTTPTPQSSYGAQKLIGEMIGALERTAGAAALKRIRWQPDPRVEAIVGTWPARFDTARAESLGFPRDERGFDGNIADYLTEEGIAVS